METKTNKVLDSVISLAENLEGSELSTEAIEKSKEQIEFLKDYFKASEIGAIFMAVIFVLQNQENESVSLHDISEFLKYPFIRMLSFRKELDILEENSLIDIRDEHNVSHHSENNGYVVCGTVINNIIDGENIVLLERPKESITGVINKILRTQSAFFDEVLESTEYYRQIMTLEKKYDYNPIVRNCVKLFPDDFGSRLLIYNLCCPVIFKKPWRRSSEDDYSSSSTIFDVLPEDIKYARIKSMDSEKDILVKKKLVEKIVRIESDGPFDTTVVIDYGLTRKAIKTLFEEEAENFLPEEIKLTEQEKIVRFLSKFAELYESNFARLRKVAMLRKYENENSNNKFVKTMETMVGDIDNRFFLYDVMNDYIKGHDSSLTRTLTDLHGKTDYYFRFLRELLDDKSILLDKDLIILNKNEVVEKTTVTITDKSVELIYGKNADLFIRKGSAKNVIGPEKLKEKTLFYSPKVQEQIDMLERSFDQKNLEAMQSRLEAKALPKGVAVLLYGAPGTGKTETVYQLCRKTNRKIFHVDIAGSKSMWYGESEKKIKKIFTDYKALCKDCKNRGENTPVLLFNEADALISKRRDIDSGNLSQTENAMQNILLEEIETLEGILIATTNLCENMDSAFERRFLFKVEYEKPSLEARTKIWKSKLPSIGDDIAEKLAKEFDFSGGEIDNIVRKSEIKEIIDGILPDYENLQELCSSEKLAKANERHMGFIA